MRVPRPINPTSQLKERKWLLLSAAALVFLAGCTSIRPSYSKAEPLWSSVPLEGMHLSLVSPKPEGGSQDLYFGKGTLAVSVCANDYCMGPATIWKIENNRLKTGYVPTEGSALVEYTTDRIAMKGPDGSIRVYSIIRK
jgi:hypothetical protein